MIRLGLAAAMGLAASAALAQPAPSFRTTCEGLRGALARLAPAKDTYFTIEVVDTLRHVASDDALAYLGMCEPPAPRVLCVTYTTDRWRVGDRAMIIGAFSEDNPGFVKLDPCLHAPAPR